MDFKYNRKNHRKYSLRVHLVFVTKYRKKLLDDTLADFVKRCCYWVSNKNAWSIIAIEADKDHLHLLLSYNTDNCVSDIVKVLKQTTTYYLWKQFQPLLSKHYWKQHIFWSDGYFACSVGEASSAIIEKYIASQG